MKDGENKKNRQEHKHNGKLCAVFVMKCKSKEKKFIKRNGHEFRSICLIPLKSHDEGQDKLFVSVKIWSC